MSRSCDAFKCGASVASGRFLCSHHWRMVPLGTQRAINARFRALRKDFAFLSDMEYLQACVDAISGIAKAEGYFVEPGAGDLSTYDRLLRVARRRGA